VKTLGTDGFSGNRRIECSVQKRALVIVRLLFTSAYVVTVIAVVVRVYVGIFCRTYNLCKFLMLTLSMRLIP